MLFSVIIVTQNTNCFVKVLILESIDTGKYWCWDVVGGHSIINDKRDCVITSFDFESLQLIEKFLCVEHLLSLPRP